MKLGADYNWGEVKEDLFRSVCRGQINRSTLQESWAKQPSIPKCHLVHHFDPYQIMGPFHLEVQLYRPLRTIIHDLFTETETNWMMEYSRPKLSSGRMISDDTTKFSKTDLKYSDGKKARTVAKTVQTWFEDIDYNETTTIRQTDEDSDGPPVYEALPLKDPYSFHIINEIMFQVS